MAHLALERWKYTASVHINSCTKFPYYYAYRLSHISFIENHIIDNVKYL